MMQQSKRKGWKLMALIITAFLLGGVMTEGCKSSKKCGCGHDLNTVYKIRKSGWR